MKVRLFGRSNDDKGTQLERLTKRLLERLGYRDVTLNFVASGGSELDIHAEYPVPGLGGQKGLPLIGECKAYEAPINLPDWLKFLGKVFNERSCRHPHTRGLFMALSGANGNVAGAYDEIRLKDPSVELIMGDRLAKLVSEEFRLPTAEIVNATVRQLTSDTVLEASIGYYNARAFWILEFSNSTFTILLGQHLQEEVAADLVTLVRGQIQAASYRNLFAETIARARRSIARKFVLGQLLTKSSLDPGEWTPMPVALEPLTSVEIEASMVDLRHEGKVIDSDASPRLEDLTANATLRGQVLRELVEGFFSLSYFGTSEWDSLIDGQLLDESLRIKDFLEIPESDRENLLRLLKWSPNALFWALSPDDLLCGHANEPAEVREALKQDHARYFKLQLLRLATSDFQTSPLNSLLLEKHGLRELEFTRTAIFKSHHGAEVEMEVAERTGIGHLDPALGGGIAVVWLTENAPQPWAIQQTVEAPPSGQVEDEKEQKNSEVEP